ncbi:MAG: hypothetical protein M3550_07540, partial [Actinomycetota bacterium]|nr:hypothetical protein [Actinomycetota bacterium]
VLWTPPPEPTLESIAEALFALGARQWQVYIAGPILEEAINRPAEPIAAPTSGPGDGPTVAPDDGPTVAPRHAASP